MGDLDTLEGGEVIDVEALEDVVTTVEALPPSVESRALLAKRRSGEGEEGVGQDTTKFSFTTPLKKKKTVKLIKLSKWVLVDLEGEGLVSRDESKVWFFNENNCKTISEIRKLELIREGVSTHTKLVYRMSPFESEAALVQKVYSYILMKEFDARVKKVLPDTLDVKERQKLVLKHYKACHAKVNTPRVKRGCDIISATVGEADYVKSDLVEQVLKQVKPFEMLQKVEGVTFEYEYCDLNAL